VSDSSSNYTVSRRSLLQALAFTPAFTVPAVWPIQAAADALVALKGANLALGAISAFARPGNGLGAMLRAQMQMLQLISIQLNNIHIELARLHETIKDTSEDQKAFINQRFLDKETSNISGAARRYSEALTASGGDPGHFTIPSVMADIEDIRNVVAQTRTSIQGVNGGLGADASLVLPVSCAVEIAVRLHLNQPTSTVKETLNGYLDWLNRILGDQPGSISSEMSSLASEHDETVDDIPDYHWLSEQMRKQLKVGSDWRNFDANECYLFVSGVVPGHNLSFDIAEGIEPYARQNLDVYTYSRSVNFSRNLNDELGAYLFEVDYANSGIRGVSITLRGGRTQGFPPHRFSECRKTNRAPAGPRMRNASQVIEYIENTALHKEFKSQEREFASFITFLNKFRAKLAYHAIARVVAIETRNEVRARLSII